jgi:hypothetical protein
MALVYKTTLLFRFQPSQELFNVAVAGRVGGWSESLWFANKLTEVQIGKLANSRAGMMGADCEIVGWRITPYTYIRNKMIPGKAQPGLLRVNGGLATFTNSPNDALRVQMTAGTIPATFTYFIHAMPDDTIDSGQFIEGPPFTPKFNLWASGLLAGADTGTPPLWVGRDPTQIAQRVLSFDGPTKVLVTEGSTGALDPADFIRLRRVYDDANNPLTGSFRVASLVNNGDGTVSYTLAGFPNRTRTTPSGTARKDIISSAPITSLDIRLLAERKVGRPTSQYRGRAVRRTR